MAATKENQTPVVDDITAVTPVKVKKENVPRVRVFLPPLEEDESGVKVDQYEHVTINGVTTLVKRGEYVDVTVPVFIQLRNKFPHI